MFVTPSGERYVGAWNKSKKHGKGRYMFSCGDFYDGDFHHDKAQGEGIYRYAASGNVFAGSSATTRRTAEACTCGRVAVDTTGAGRTTISTERGLSIREPAFQGRVFAQQKHGRGIFTWNTGNEYKGLFADDKLCGLGEMIPDDKSSLCGTLGTDNKRMAGHLWYADTTPTMASSATM